MASGSSQGSDDGDDDDDCGRRENIRCVIPCGRVGVETLPDQLVDRCIQQGFCFNILCVGDTGIGKSTLINTLFNAQLEAEGASHFHSQVGLRACTHQLREGQVLLTLTVVSTVGFGDQVNREECHLPITSYIEAQLDAHLQEELRIPRAPAGYRDSCLHACLYFIPPTGHSLRALDLCTMKSLGTRVNLIPLIAKADTLSRAELCAFKARVMSELVSHGVQIYQFPTEDGGSAAVSRLLPFAVVGATEEVRVGDRRVRGRRYEWGVVEVENEEHCDLAQLREMLVCASLEDLRQQTHERHYERFRRRRLRELGWADAGLGRRPGPPADALAARRRELRDACRRREEEVQRAFARRAREKEALLKQAERQLQARCRHLERAQQKEVLRLEERRRALEEEMLAFSRRKAACDVDPSQALVASGTSKKKDKKKEPGCRMELLCFDILGSGFDERNKDAEETEEAYCATEQP
ncbi:septin-10-like [Ctenodactylus gundi]